MEKWTTAGKPLNEPDTPWVEQIVFDGTTFGSKAIITVRLFRGDPVGITKGEAIRIAWRMGWAIAKALDNNGWWDTYRLNQDESTIENPPEEQA